MWGTRTPSRGRLNARCRFSQRTFAGTPGNGRDATIPAVCRTAMEPELRHLRDIPGCADYRVAGGAVIRARLVAVSTAGLRQLVDQPVRFSRIAGVENAKYCCRSASGGLVAP